MTAMDRAGLLDFILDHFQNPRHYGELPGADVSQEGGNPGCGDVVTIYLKADGDRAAQVQFTGSGCTISQAAASILADHVQGLTFAEIEALDHHFLIDELGEEMVQTRPRCSTLAIDTLKSAIHQQVSGNRSQGTGIKEHRSDGG
jgi:nitrogen fixation NifU-like protein